MFLPPASSRPLPEEKVTLVSFTLPPFPAQRGGSSLTAGEHVQRQRQGPAESGLVLGCALLSRGLLSSS